MEEGSWKMLGEVSARLNLPAVALPPGVGPGIRVLVCVRDPARMLAAAFTAAGEGACVAVANPDWSAAGWERARSVVRPEVVMGDDLPEAVQPSSGSGSAEAPPEWAKPGTLWIPTGGSTGEVRFAAHTPATLMPAARAVCERLDVERYHALCVVPVYHVGGLIQAVRAFWSGGSVRFASWRSLIAQEWREMEPEGIVLSLVPTQLKRALSDRNLVPWLRRFRAILVGGGAMDGTTAAAARDARLPLAPCYGMTETAAAVTLMPPDAFLAGAPGCGRALGHAKIAIHDRSGAPAAGGEAGRIVVHATSLCLGYLPGGPLDRESGLATGDRGLLDERGSLHVSGRVDFAINTGGELVFVEEVEGALLELEGVGDALVLGVPDPEWGERVAALVVPRPGMQCLPEELSLALRSRLAPHQRPKEIHVVSELPRNALGKPDRTCALRLVL